MQRQQHQAGFAQVQANQVVESVVDPLEKPLKVWLGFQAFLGPSRAVAPWPVSVFNPFQGKTGRIRGRFAALGFLGWLWSFEALTQS